MMWRRKRKRKKKKKKKKRIGLHYNLRHGGGRLNALFSRVKM